MEETMAWAMRGLIIAAATGSVVAANAVSLTGICGFVTDASGNWQIGWYNTHGPDGGKNAYVVRDSVNGAFLNSGNGAATQVSVDLSTPGDYLLYAYFDGNEIYSGRDFWGLNLFFDGDASNPGISAFGRPQSAGEDSHGFWANSCNTLDLAAGANVWGSGQLAYRSGNTEIILTDYSTTKDVFNFDRVDNFQLGSSGRNDHVTVIGLHVVPEPATVATLGAGVLALIRRRRRTSES